MLARILLIPFIILLFLFPLAGSSVFNYSPGDLNVSPIPPPVVFYDPNVPGVSVTLGPNSTSANVLVKASNAPYDILVNGEFNGPNPWIFIPGTVLTSAVVAPVYAGRVGVARISGTSPLGSNDIAFLYQTITWPSFPILSGLFEIEFCVDVAPLGFFGLYQYGIGYVIIDAATNLIVTQGGITNVVVNNVCTSLNWNTLSLGVNIGAMVPGNQYYFALQFRIREIFGSGYSVSFNVDNVSLILTPNQPVFQGIVLYANVSSGVYNSSLSLVSFSSVGVSDLNITLKNNTVAQYSSPLSIDNNVVVSSATSELIITPVPPGYYSLEIHLSSIVDIGGSISSTLYFIYRVNQGVYVYYPVNITVVDPPNRPLNPSAPPDRVYEFVVDPDPPFIDALADIN